jgi:hypothetical protein
VVSVRIVVDPPVLEDAACVPEAAEQMLIESFISQSAVEAFYKTILDGLSRRDVVPFQTTVLLPCEHGV